MGNIVVSAKGMVDAPEDMVYRYIADMHAMQRASA
jgi:hypothetical protein